MTQHDVERVDRRSAYGKLGFPGEASVQVGEYSALPHGSRTPQVIREGIDRDDRRWLRGGRLSIRHYADVRAGQCTDSDKMKKVFEIVHRAQAAALAAARPGVECGAVDAAARKVITDAGFGPDYKFFTHRVGHGIGHGRARVALPGARQYDSSCSRGMTFSDEPGIYIRGEFGVRLEDDMHITENGAELFTPQSPSLEDPFGKA